MRWRPGPVVLVPEGPRLRESGGLTGRGLPLLQGSRCGPPVAGKVSPVGTRGDRWARALPGAQGRGQTDIRLVALSW